MVRSEILRVSPCWVPLLAFLIPSASILAFGLYIAAILNPLGGLLLAAFAGLILCFSVLYLWPGRVYLELNPEGFHERGFSGRMTRKFRWSEVDSFFTIGINEVRRSWAPFKGPVVVGFRLRVSYPGSPPNHPSPIKLLSNNDYQISTRDLVDLLNEWRVRYGAKPPQVKEVIDDWIS